MRFERVWLEREVRLGVELEPVAEPGGDDFGLLLIIGIMIWRKAWDRIESRSAGQSETQSSTAES